MSILVFKKKIIFLLLINIFSCEKIPKIESNKPKSYNYLIALAYAYGNNADKVSYWLERSYENKDIMLTYLKVDPAFEKFRTEARVKTILQKMNYPD